MATAELTESAFWGNEGGGILVAIGATLTSRDIEVVDSGADALLSIAPSVEVRIDSIATIEGGHFETARAGGVLLSENGELTLRDAVVRDTRPSIEDNPVGLGVSLEGEGVLRLERVLLEDLLRTGIVAMPESALTLVDVAIRHVDAVGGRNLGIGVSTFSRSATLERVVVEDATFLGIAVSGEMATATLTDVLVSGTRSDPAEGLLGRGLEANLGAQVTGERIVLLNNREVGLTAYDALTQVTLNNLVLRGTMPAACGASCGGNAAGYGVTIQQDASVAFTNFIVDDSAVLGVQVGPNSSFSGQRGEIAGSPIGLNIQNSDFDLNDALEDVAFRDIERNVDAQILPLPAPGI